MGGPDNKKTRRPTPLDSMPPLWHGLGSMFSMLQRWALFPSYLIHPVPNASAGIEGLESLWIDTDQGPVEAWFLPGRGVSCQTPGPAIFFAHGNGELIDHWPHPLSAYREMGCSVLLVEYRGYGRSAGTPSEQHLVADALRFYDLLAARPDVDTSRILFHGRSIGGGVVCGVAAERRPRAMLLMSTFTSMRDLVRRWLVPSFLVRDVFDNLSVVSDLDVPMLMVHGRGDNLVPVSHAKELVEAAAEAQLLQYDGSHNIWPASFFDDVEPFLRRAGILDPANVG